jgi:hypothetical protein
MAKKGRNKSFRDAPGADQADRKKAGRKKAGRHVPAFWLWHTFDGKFSRFEEVHGPPTEDQLEDLLRELMEWREAHPEAMPPELWDRLNKYLQWPMRPFQEWTQERKDRVRWEYVRKGIRLRGRDDAFEYASNALNGTPPEGEPDTMEWSFKNEQRRRKLRASGSTDRASSRRGRG